VKEDRVYLDHILHNIAAVQRLAAKGKAAFLLDEDAQAAATHCLQTPSGIRRWDLLRNGMKI
jgi:uncharacterized protein with HEPN domain